MKKMDIFYLFLLLLIVIYYFYCEYKEKKYLEGFISHPERKKLYDKYFSDFKNNDTIYSDYSNDLDLFVEATEVFTKDETPYKKPELKPYVYEPILPKAPKGKNIGISNSNFDKYNIEPEVDTITALETELENITNEIMRQNEEPYPDKELIKELNEESDGIKQMIKEEEQKKDEEEI